MSNTFFQGSEKNFTRPTPGTVLRQSRDRNAPDTLSASVRSLWLLKQDAEHARRLLYYWSSLRNNNTAVKLQMFTSRYGGRRFGACDQGSHWYFFNPDLFFSQPVCLGYYEKSREICVVEVINSSSVLDWILKFF